MGHWTPEPWDHSEEWWLTEFPESRLARMILFARAWRCALWPIIAEIASWRWLRWAMREVT